MLKKIINKFHTLPHWRGGVKKVWKIPYFFFILFLRPSLSILGMNLFGCKFCDPETGNCERKNFDSLLWATVTVFQVAIDNQKG